MYQIEANLKPSLYGSYKYLSQHDSWYFEIDANNYGVNKALEYYHNNPNDDHVDLEYLQYLKNRFKANELTYDFDSFFTLYNIYREKIPFYSNVRNTLSNIFLKNKNMMWHKVLYGDKKQLISIDEIINNPSVSELDSKFINRVLTSRYLNRRTNYDNLDYDTLLRLSLEFQNRLTETCNTADSNLCSYMKKKDLVRVKRDIEYYKNILASLQARIDVYNKMDKNCKS